MKIRQLINEDWKSVLASADLKTLAIYRLLVAFIYANPNDLNYDDVGIIWFLKEPSNIKIGEYLNNLNQKYSRQISYDMRNLSTYTKDDIDELRKNLFDFIDSFSEEK